MSEFVSILERLRPGYKSGGIATPKRGLVDEPGSYSTPKFKDSNPKYQFIKDYLNNFLKDKKGKVNISSVELAKDIVKKSKGKKFYYANGVEMSPISYKTVHGLITTDSKFKNKFNFTPGRTFDPAYQTKLDKAVKAYKNLPTKTKRKMMTGGIGATDELNKFMKKQGLYRTKKSKFAEKSGRELVSSQESLDRAVFSKALKDANVKRPAPLKKGTADRRTKAKRVNILGEIGSRAYEDHLDNYKRSMQRYMGIKPIKTKTGKKMLPLDTAHRTSIDQLKKLRTKLDPSDLGLDFQDVNRKQIKSLEIDLNRLYKTQFKLYNNAKKFKKIPTSLSKQIFFNNDKIIETINESPFRDRLKPITVNPVDLSIKKGSVITDAISKQLGVGLVDKPLSEIQYSRSLKPGGEYAPGTKKSLRFPGSIEDTTIKINMPQQIVQEAYEAGKIKKKDYNKILKKGEEFVGLKKVADDKALGRKLLKGSGKFLRGAGKIIKPLGVLTGIAAVNTAVKAGERNPFDLTGAYITGDAQIATDARRMRQEPEFRRQQLAGLPQIQPEGFEMMEEEDFTSYFNGGIVAVKGVIN